MSKAIGNTENKFIELMKFRGAYMLLKLEILRRELSSHDPDVLELLGQLEKNAASMRQDAIDYENWRKRDMAMPDIQEVDRTALLMAMTDLLEKANDIADRIDILDDEQNNTRLKRVK